MRPADAGEPPGLTRTLRDSGAPIRDGLVLGFGALPDAPLGLGDPVDVTVAGLLDDDPGRAQTTVHVS